MSTDKEVIENRLDLEMLERPYLWPLGNIIFLKRTRNGKIETGPCVLDEGNYIIKRHKWGTDASIDTITYSSAQMVIDDGWEVD